MANSNGGNGQGQAAMQQQGAKTIADLLEGRRGEMEKALPKHLSVDRLLRVALTAVQKTPALMKCSGSSLLMAVMNCAELGLEPGGALGHAYLIPYGQNCQLIIGYRGLLELARRSGDLSQIEAHVVYSNDEYELVYGLEPRFRHKPNLTGKRGEPVFVYMVARLKDGSQHVEVMTYDEVEAIRLRSRSGNEGPWKTDWGEMAKKTVLRRGSKYLPLSSERLTRALEIDNEDFVDGEVVARTEATANVVSLPEPSKTERLKKKLAAETATKPVIDVQPGQSEEDAERMYAGQEPPPDVDLPTVP